MYACDELLSFVGNACKYPVAISTNKKNPLSLLHDSGLILGTAHRHSPAFHCLWFIEIIGGDKLRFARVQIRYGSEWNTFRISFMVTPELVHEPPTDTALHIYSIS
jgi:hypothetical protein